MTPIDRQIILLNEQNIKFCEISKAVNCTVDKVRYTLQKYNLYIQKKTYNVQLDEFTICELYKQDVLIVNISKQFNTSVNPIKKCLKKHNIMKPAWLTNLKYQYVSEILDKEFLYAKYCETYNKVMVAKYFECGSDLIDSAFKKHNLKYFIGGQNRHANNIKTAEFELTVENVDYLYNTLHLPISEVATKCKVGHVTLSKYMSINNITTRTTGESRYSKIAYDLRYNTTRDDIIELYTNNSINQITKMFNFPYISHTLSLLAHHNIPISKHESSQHKEIAKYLTETLNLTIINNTRKLIPPYEIDIFIPEYNIGIEVNGVYWHSEIAGKNKGYHNYKTVVCQQQNIQLIQIFENEWVLKTDIVKSRLCSIFKKINNKIYARQCKVQILTNSEYSEFMCVNHIQGAVNAEIKLGLCYNNVIVCAMSFGKSRYNKNYQYELYRYANKLHTTVVGGASKLLSYAIKTYNLTSIISYSDRRWSVGNMYTTLGFTYLRSTTANYYYFTHNTPYNLESRQKYQKHKLSNKLPLFDPELTEWDNMRANGFNRIWDCGMDVWVYHAPIND